MQKLNWKKAKRLKLKNSKRTNWPVGYFTRRGLAVHMKRDIPGYIYECGVYKRLMVYTNKPGKVTCGRCLARM
jgi:hypothetical protein